MHGLRSEIARGYKKVLHDFSLDAEIPERRIRIVNVITGRLEHSAGREFRVRVQHEWERTPARNTSPRIIQSARRTGLRISLAPWRGGGNVFSESQRVIFVAQGVGRADRHAAVALWIPGQS